MILNISGRTDIVAFYSRWLKNRIEAGFFDVRNPFNVKLVSRIYMDDVDAIVFCTKNPLPIIDYLPQINKPISFQVTLTPYKNDIEPNVIDKSLIIEGIKKVSEIVGVENTFVRFDPIFISEKYDVNYHIRAFERVCSLLEGYVKTIIVSFLDDYKNVRKNYPILQYRKLTQEDYELIGRSFSESAKKHNMIVQTCYERRNLVEYGFTAGECVSKDYAYKLTGKNYSVWTARKGGKCGCVTMVDVGYYNSCNHRCKYCYANFDEDKICSNMLNHNPDSSLLIGQIQSDDVIKVRKK